MAMTNTNNTTNNTNNTAPIKEQKGKDIRHGKPRWIFENITSAPFAHAYPELLDAASPLDRAHSRPCAGFGDPQLNLRVLPHLARPR